MPTFRFHRGSLEDSMKTCFVVHSLQDLFDKINEFNSLTGEPRKDSDMICISPRIIEISDLKIEPYIFDDRIGWNTHIVLVKRQCFTKDPYIIGFLSDNLKDVT